MVDNLAIDTRHILIVDDDQLTAFALMSALKADDRNILAVSGGSQALSEMRSRYYDLVFLEIGLVDRTGMAVLEEVSQNTPSTCVVVMSAGILDDQTESTIIDHDHFFLPKPFEILQVRTMVNRILSRQGSSRERSRRSDEGGKERRRWPRSAHSGQVVCLPCRDSAQSCVPESFRAQVADVSRGGVGLKTDQALPPGQRIQFKGDTAFWDGIVRWSLVSGSRFRAGVEFE